MTTNRETELKLVLAPDALEFLASGGLAGEELKLTDLHSVYYDTRNRKLWKAGLVLRVRQDRSKIVQSIKSGSGSLGRGEWEAELADAEPAAGAAEGSPLAPFLKKRKIRNDLRPVFTVDVERHIGMIDREGAKIELALDRGVIRAAREQMPLCEAELELKEGDKRALFELAAAIGEKTRAFVSLQSKAERGYALLRGESRTPLKRPTFQVSPGTSTGEAVSSIGSACLATLFENTALFLASQEVEALHQSRVSVRRLRAIWSLFKPILGGDEAGGVTGEMKWISDALGRARNLDVFLSESLSPMAQAYPDAPGFPGLGAVLEARRKDAYGTLLDGLRSQRFYALSLALVRRLDGDPWAFDATDIAAGRRDQPIECFVADALGGRLRSILKKSDDLRSLSPAARHRIRIKSKKLRYMAEPFSDLADGKGFKFLLKQLKALQGALGKLNDARVSTALMNGIGHGGVERKGGNLDYLFAAGLVVGAQRQDPGLLDEAQKARDRLARTRPFWER